MGALPSLKISRRLSLVLDKAKKAGSGSKIERIFYTFAEAQDFLNISRDTLYQLINHGLSSHKIGRKRVFLKEDLIKWIKEH